MKLTPNITLSNGRIIGSRYAENGSQDLFDVADPERLARLSDSEHAEVMAAIKAFRNPTGDPFDTCPGPKLGRPIVGRRCDRIADQIEKLEAKRIDAANVAEFERQMQQASGKLF